MNDNNVIEFADRRASTPRPAVSTVTSERIVNLAMQARLLPTTLSLSEIVILGEAILAHGGKRAATRPSS